MRLLAGGRRVDEPGGGGRFLTGLLPPPPHPPLPPQATATTIATVRTTSPLARTIWFPLVLVGRPSANHTDASHHLPPSSQLASGRECAGGECGHMGWPNCYSEANY